MRGESPSSPLYSLGISYSHLNDSPSLSESLSLSTSLSLSLSLSLSQRLSCSTTSGYKEGKAAGMASLQHTSINTTVLCKKGAISVVGVSALPSSLPRFRTIVAFARGNTPTFPRINVQDPYRRLGVSRDASEKEIWSSRNFLLAQYAPHERSAESIELAFEKLLMDSFVRTKKRKINLKSMLKKQVQESPPWFKNLLGFVEVPPTVIILRRLFLFAFIAGWSIMNSAETGPAFQVAISLGACIYFLNGKKKSLAKSSMIGLGLLVAGWTCGSFLVPAIPAALLHPSWTLELITSLVAYVFLFLGCTFLK